MNKVGKLVNTGVKEVENVVKRTLDNQYISNALKVFIVLYAAFAAPKLPPSLVNLMDNTLVRVGFAFAIVALATQDPSMALILSVAFVITIQTANKYRLVNADLSTNKSGGLSWLPSVKEQEPQEPQVPQESDEPQEPQEPDNNSESAEKPPMLPHHTNVEKEDVVNMSYSKPSENFQDGRGSDPVPTRNTDVFTNDYQFLTSQSNQVPGANQDSSLATFENQHSIQGLHDNVVDGFESDGYNKY